MCLLHLEAMTSDHNFPLCPTSSEDPRGCVSFLHLYGAVMFLNQSTAAPPAICPAVRIGVGIDTSRYGHYAAFLRDDLQPAAAELQFTESADGYAQFRHRLEVIAQRHPPVSFAIRLDVAGQYAD